MNVQILIATDGCEKAKGTCVVFDVLRASSVECHLHLVGAKKVIPQEKIEDTLAMKAKDKDVVLLGERSGIKLEGFDFNNSPKQVLENADKIKGKIAYHNTEAGTQAINKCLECKNVDEVLVCSPNNINATLKYLKSENKKDITLVAAGCVEKCYEDLLVCEYFKSLLLGETPKMNMEQIKQKAKETTGSKFFKGLSYFTPEDFDICFKENIFNKNLKMVGNETRCFDV